MFLNPPPGIAFMDISLFIIPGHLIPYLHFVLVFLALSGLNMLFPNFFSYSLLALPVTVPSFREMDFLIKVFGL